MNDEKEINSHAFFQRIEEFFRLKEIMNNFLELMGSKIPTPLEIANNINSNNFLKLGNLIIKGYKDDLKTEEIKFDINFETGEINLVLFMKENIIKIKNYMK